MSEYDNALDCYKKVIDLMPDTDYAADALSAIESIYQSEGRGDEFLDYAELIGATRDKTDASVRAEVARRANLVRAVRLLVPFFQILLSLWQGQTVVPVQTLQNDNF